IGLARAGCRGTRPLRAASRLRVAGRANPLQRRDRARRLRDGLHRTAERALCGMVSRPGARGAHGGAWTLEPRARGGDPASPADAAPAPCRHSPAAGRPHLLRQPREDPGTLLAARRVDLDRLRTLRERATHVVARGDLAGGDDVEAGTAFEEQLLVAPEVVARHRGAYAGCPQLGAQL